MQMIESLETVTTRLSEAIDAVQQYRDGIAADVEGVRARPDVDDRVKHIWEWQLTAATELLELLDDEAWNRLQRIVEQDFILRLPNVDDILI